MKKRGTAVIIVLLAAVLCMQIALIAKMNTVQSNIESCSGLAGYSYDGINGSIYTIRNRIKSVIGQE